MSFKNKEEKSSRCFIWAVVFIVIVGVGVWGYLQYSIINIDKDLSGNELTPRPNNRTGNTAVPQEEEQTKDVAETNQKGYYLQSYSLKDSPIYSNLADIKSGGFSCHDIYWQQISKDVRLVKNGEVIVPSLLRLVSDSDNVEPSCSTAISLFSAPADEKYLYLKTIHILTHGGYVGWSGIYQLNLSDLSIKKLAVSDFVGKPELFSFFVPIEDTYHMLPDGERLVKWKMNGVSLINLESDSKITLYTVPENQWLVSKLYREEEVVDVYYDVNIENGLMTVGVYDKTHTEDGESVSVDEQGRISPFLNYQKGMNFKFLKQITLSIYN